MLGGWRLEVGGWRLEVGGWRLEVAAEMYNVMIITSNGNNANAAILLKRPEKKKSGYERDLKPRPL